LMKSSRSRFRHRSHLPSIARYLPEVSNSVFRGAFGAHWGRLPSGLC
jgi:hypothetical protein